MGGFCTTQVEPLPDYSEVVTDTQLPAWVSEGGKRLFEEASSLARSPYPTYDEPRIASYGGSKLTPEEQQASELLRRGASTYQTYIDESSDMARTLGQGFDRQSRDQLIGESMSPFTMETAQPFLDIYQGAQDRAVDEVRRQTELANMQNRATAARSGAFGGSRLGIQEALTQSEGARTAGDLRARAAAEGLQFAASRFDQDRAQAERDRAARFAAEDQARAGFETEEASRLRATEALQGFAPLVQGLQDQAASGLFTAGQARRALDQRALDLAYADYVEQRQFPFDQINYALGVLQGTPYDTRNISLTQGQQFVQTPNIYGQTLGGLGSLASAYYIARGGR
jgi:hypothetical protein